MKKERLERLIASLGTLSEGQLKLVESAVGVFQLPHKFCQHSKALLLPKMFADFGDALRLHHAFSAEPFTKDKFEFLLWKTLTASKVEAALAARGNPGHDISIADERFSLKTQADKAVKPDRIWISKFMELGRGKWENERDLAGLRDSFLRHLEQYDRILSLRALRKAPQWHYELVEIPKAVLQLAASGQIVMQHDSRQTPKPGYCDARDNSGTLLFRLYFDGGTERKLQVKDLVKSACVVHGEWEFTAPQSIL